MRQTLDIFRKFILKDIKNLESGCDLKTNDINLKLMYARLTRNVHLFSTTSINNMNLPSCYVTLIMSPL